MDQQLVETVPREIETTLSRWLNDPLAGKIAVLILGLCFIYYIFRVIQRISLGYVKEPEAARRVASMINFFSYSLSFLFFTSIFKDRLGGLTVAFGVAGAGIAFALQEVIASVAGWLALMLGSIYTVGDRIEVAGIRGDVVSIGFLRTVLMEVGQWVKSDLYTGRVVVIPNSAVLKSPVYNYSSNFPFLWDEVTIPIKYGSDSKLSRQLLQEAAIEELGEFVQVAEDTWHTMLRTYALEQASLHPMITLALNDNWMEYTIRYVVDFKSRRRAQNRLFENILSRVEQTNGKVGFASATFQLVETPVFKVEMQPASEAKVV
jgi:small-conductance mechanosensitive channel